MKTATFAWFAAVVISCLPGSLFAAPEIGHWQTRNGINVYFVEAPEIPIVDIRFVFNAGSVRDGSKPGISSLVNRLLKDGAAELDANKFNEAIASTGANFSTGSLRDMAWVSVRSLTENQYLEPALQLVSSVLSNPRFDADAFERRKAQALVNIKREQQSPGAVATKAFYKAVYGEHPYGTPLPGTVESVSKISRADVLAFHQRHYVAANCSIAIVGAVSRRQAEEISQQLSRDMAPGAPLPPVATVPMLSGPSDQRIDFPSIQSHVRIGQPGLKRGDPDYFPLLVGNHVLGGGGLVSILFDEVREKRGLSYSVNSYFSPMAELGPFTASLQTDNSRADEAITVLRDELRKFISQGPTEEALEAAKQNLIGGFPLRIASNSKTVEYLAMIGFYKLPLDYLNSFTEHVRAVNLEDVRAAFKRRLDPAKMAMVVVGGKNGNGG